MDRVIVYPGSIPQDTDILNTNRNTMIALGMLAQAAFGTANFVDGLAGTQTATPSLTINIGPGVIGSYQNVDNNAYGSLGTDTAAQIMKLGINLGTVQLTMTAPSTAGYSTNYLVSAAFAETDTGSTVLPYVNAANPGSPYSGPGNDGVSQYTDRVETVQINLTAGVPNTAGSQTTPATPSGNVPLYVVTVANGQTSILTSGITEAPNAGFIRYKIPAMVPGFCNPVQFGTVGTFGLGSGGFLVPPGVTQIYAKLYGGGGGGGAAGGGGGGMAEGVIAVTPGETLTVIVGSGGAGGANGSSGTQSVIKRGTTVLMAAYAGGGGSSNGTTVGTSGGASGGTFNRPGQSGGTVLTISSSTIGGFGGASGGGFAGGPYNGGGGATPGGGGGGGSNGGNGAAGGQGEVDIWY